MGLVGVGGKENEGCLVLSKIDKDLFLSHSATSETRSVKMAYDSLHSNEDTAVVISSA